MPRGSHSGQSRLERSFVVEEEGGDLAGHMHDDQLVAQAAFLSVWPATRGGDHETCRLQSSLLATWCYALTGHDDTCPPRAWRRGCTFQHGLCT
ncbi:MAG: hypothetical protein OXI53_11330 [Nitrospira sp.]|nr:hypothetical protein [Nitrospira sp.]